MSLIHRYLFIQTVVTLLITTLTLTALIVIIYSLRIVDLMINTQAPFFLFIKLIALTVPTFLGVLLPITVSGSILFIYNKKIINSELVILSSAGLGPWQLALPALILAFIVTTGSFYLSLYGQPFAHRSVRYLKQTILNEFASVLIHQGTLIDSVDGLIIYVSARNQTGQMTNIMIHDRRIADQETTLIAARGIIDSTANGLRLILEKGLRQEFNHQTQRFSELYFDRYIVTFQVFDPDRSQRIPKLRELSIEELIFPPLSVRNAPQEQRRYTAELHIRLATSLLTLTFSFIALATVFFKPYSVRKQGWSLIFGSVIIACVKILSLGLIGLTKYSIGIPLLYLCCIIPIVIATWVMTARGSYLLSHTS